MFSDPVAIAVMSVAWLVSLGLVPRLLRSDRHWLEKVGGIVLLAVPLAGPLLYWLVLTEVPPRDPSLRNTGARGDYTHDDLALREAKQALLASIEAANREREERQRK